MCYDPCSDEYCFENREHGCTCKNCYSELSCSYEHGIIADCIEKDSGCEDRELHVKRLENWDKTNYHFKLKSGLMVTTS